MAADAEPFYVRQARVPEGGARRWLERHAAEARSRGARHARFTRHPADGRLLLVEAWAERPEDEGEQRWWGARRARVAGASAEHGADAQGAGSPKGPGAHSGSTGSDPEAELRPK